MERIGRCGLTVLTAGVALVLFLAGLDKWVHFFEKSWDHYLSPMALGLLHGSGHQFMQGVSIWEMLLAVALVWLPRIFGFVAAAWFALIVANLIASGDSYDDALRDFGLCTGAFALGCFATYFHKRRA